jgi:hypothetical protein
MSQRMSQELKGSHAPNQVNRKGLEAKMTEEEEELRPFLLLLPRRRETERGAAA